MNNPERFTDAQETGEWIIKVDMSEPAIGFFRAKLGKGCLSRAIAVIATQHLPQKEFSVYLDGVLVASESRDWRIAFGKLYAGGKDLIGERITQAQYIALVKQRRQDLEKGIDLDAPFDHNRFPVP